MARAGSLLTVFLDIFVSERAAADANELTGVPACAGAMSVCILSDGGACVQKEQ